MEAKLYFDDDLDALRATVTELGGFKAVGGKLWPDKPSDKAGRLLADCCNSSRSERLTPSQLLFVMRMAREAGVHSLADHFMACAGYAKPIPVSPADEEAEITRRVEDLLGTAGHLVARLERLRAGARA